MNDVAILLRGVNVGRARRISADQLRSVASAAGVENPRTLLNSGNVVGRSGTAAPLLAEAVSVEIARQVGFTCDVVVRSRAALERSIKRDPLRDVAADPSRHLLVALASAPDAVAVGALRATDVAPDEWVLDGEDLHAWMPEGVSNSLLQRALAAGVLGVPWTGRNWSTVARIVAAMG